MVKSRMSQESVTNDKQLPTPKDKGMRSFSLHSTTLIICFYMYMCMYVYVL